jgi:hypothetical protein
MTLGDDARLWDSIMGHGEGPWAHGAMQGPAELLMSRLKCRHCSEVLS